MGMKQGEWKNGIWIPTVMSKETHEALREQNRKLMINNPKGHNRHTPKSELKGKPVSKYEAMTREEKAVLVFALRKRGKEMQNKAAGILSLASKLENEITNFKEKEYSDEELMEEMGE